MSVLPPDCIETGEAEKPGVNLFLWRVAPSLVRRNAGLMPRMEEERATHPLPPLELSYLLSAYGAKELEREVLLGYAIGCLESAPVLGAHGVLVSLGAPGCSDITKSTPVPN